jgi:hypothetical protein
MRGAVTAVVLAVLAAGCGGARQDADEPSGTFKVEVVSASFPARQHIAQPVILRLRVRNADTRALPDVAVTVETVPATAGQAPVGFGQRADDPALADPSRPVWLLDRGPLGGDTAYVNTWLAGPLRAGESKVMTWRLVAAKAGTYTVGYRVSPGLDGRAKPAGGRTAGSFHVTIEDAPVPAHVGLGGSIVRGKVTGGD